MTILTLTSEKIWIDIHPKLLVVAVCMIIIHNYSLSRQIYLILFGSTLYGVLYEMSTSGIGVRVLNLEDRRGGNLLIIKVSWLAGGKVKKIRAVSLINNNIITVLALYS